MKRKGKLQFDPKVFLSKVNGGRTISDYRKDQIVYTQGEPADSVFYIQSGKVKKTVVSEQGKEAVVALLETDDFFGEGCLTGQPLRLATGLRISGEIEWHRRPRSNAYRRGHGMMGQARPIRSRDQGSVVGAGDGRGTGLSAEAEAGRSTGADAEAGRGEGSEFL
jgi:hypothetical protein